MRVSLFVVLAVVGCARVPSQVHVTPSSLREPSPGASVDEVVHLIIDRSLLPDVVEVVAKELPPNPMLMARELAHIRVDGLQEVLAQGVPRWVKPRVRELVLHETAPEEMPDDALVVTVELGEVRLDVDVRHGPVSFQQSVGTTDKSDGADGSKSSAGDVVSVSGFDGGPGVRAAVASVEVRLSLSRGSQSRTYYFTGVSDLGAPELYDAAELLRVALERVIEQVAQAGLTTEE